jgi:hypothetical protein
MSYIVSHIINHCIYCFHGLAGVMISIFDNPRRQPPQEKNGHKYIYINIIYNIYVYICGGMRGYIWYVFTCIHDIFTCILMHARIYWQKNIYVYVDQFSKTTPATPAIHANSINIYCYMSGVYDHCGGSTTANKKWRI